MTDVLTLLLLISTSFASTGIICMLVTISIIVALTSPVLIGTTTLLLHYCLTE